VVTPDMVYATDIHRLARFDIRSNVHSDFPLPVSVLERLPKGVEVALYGEFLSDRVNLSWKSNGKIDQASTEPNPRIMGLFTDPDGPHALTVFRAKMIDALKAMKNVAHVSIGETVLMDAEGQSRGYAVGPQIAFQRKKMLQGLQWFTDEVMTIRFGYGTDPIVLRQVPKVYYVMPFKIDFDRIIYSSEYLGFLQEHLKESLDDV
jgi:hypothetical protein